jgi:hypothetical protein
MTIIKKFLSALIMNIKAGKIILPLLTSCMVFNCHEDKSVIDNPSNSQGSDVRSRQYDEGIHGTKLAHIDFDNEGFASFWEFSPGQIAIRFSEEVENTENPVMSSVEKKIDQLLKDNRSALDIYYELTLHPKAEDIAQITAASVRQRDLNNKQVYGSGPVTDNAPANSTSINDPFKTGRASSLIQCSPDYYNNGYHGSWFLYNYCTEGAFRFCRDNLSYAYSGSAFRSTWFKTVVMAADFAQGVPFKGWYWWRDCFFCNWYRVAAWDYIIQPRRIEGWYFTGEGWRQSEAGGEYTCRLHYALMWNQ